MKTTGRVMARWAGWSMTVEKSREPGGASQTLLPLPRPATCVVAVNVKPVGTLERILGFLYIVLDLGYCITCGILTSPKECWCWSRQLRRGAGCPNHLHPL